MALSFLKSKKESSLGIDIGTSSVKIVELQSESGGKIELTNYGEGIIGTDTILQSSSSKLSVSQATEIIKKVIKEAKIIETRAIMSLPVFSGFSTVISLPEMPDSELDQAVLYEAKKYIPLPLSEVQFEWVKIKSVKKDTINVLIVAVTNELISKYQEIAKLSGLTLSYLELDTFSMARSLISEMNKSVLIINIGSRNTTLSLVENEWPIVTRSLDMSGFEFSKLIASTGRIDFVHAEELKKQKGTSADSGALLPLLDTLFLEGRLMIEENSLANRIPISDVIISGGSARMPGLLEYASKILGRKVVIGYPFNGIVYPRVLEATLHELAPSLDVAIGLALREFR
jgi:type IV pilus assembly protein PilM